MNAWQIFWEACLWVAGAAFAGITIIVTIRGFADMRQMFANLNRENRKK
jgi:hypothetical protein